MALATTGAKLADWLVGLGPGFTAGVDVHAVVETQRGNNLGRVLYQGKAAADTGVPGAVMGYAAERLLRAPAAGVVMPCRRIGDSVIKGDITAFVRNLLLRADIWGRVGEWVARGTKIGDIDPRAGSPGYCFSISDKALTVGGGVLEAVCGYYYLDKKGSNCHENYGSPQPVR